MESAQSTKNKDMDSSDFLKKGLLIFTLQLIAWGSGYSQSMSLEENHSLIHHYKESLQDTINKHTEIDRPFVLGRMQAFHGNSVHHPYFIDHRPVAGSLVFKNQVYEADALLYDIHNDKLVYRYYSGNFEINNIALDENFVSEFTIYNSVFRYFRDLKTKSGIKQKDGYYEVVYDGDSKFLVRWEKTKSFDFNAPDKFEDIKSMYLLKDGMVVRIKNKLQLMKQFADKKREVKKHMRETHLILELGDDSSIDTVLEYYERLLK